MAEDDQGKREDLFEDLDKFFAPIRDVDWPEDRPAPRAEEPQRPVPPVPPTPPTPPAPPPVPGPQSIQMSAYDDDRETGREASRETVRPTIRQPIRIGEDDDEEGYVPLPPVRITDDEPAPSPEDLEAAADYFAGSIRDEGSSSDEPSPSRWEEEQEPAPVHVPDTTGEFGSIAALLGEIEGREAEAVAPPRTIVVGPDGMEGPSWQDPTSVEVGSGDDRPARRNVPLAALTGLALAAVAVVTLVLGGPWFALFAGVAVVLGMGEWYQAVRKQGGQPATAIGMASGALLLAAAYLRGEAAMLGMIPLSIVATFLWYLAQSPSHRRDVGANIASTLMGVAYVGLLAGYALLILGLPDGEALLMGVVGLTIAYDTAAFAAGYLWGSRPLAPSVSPQKSWEGAIGGTILALGVSIGVVAPAVPVLGTIGRAAALAIVVAIFAPLGDLAESLLKRDLGVKDMGNILPGHGGILDRVDALLFVMPAAFFFFRLVG